MDILNERAAGTMIRGAIAARENEPASVRDATRDELARQARDEAERRARTTDILKIVNENVVEDTFLQIEYHVTSEILGGYAARSHLN